MAEPTIKYNPFASVSIIEYRNLLMGRFTFTLAIRMLTTVMGWWIYNLTNDPFAIGLLGLSEVIPAVSLALYAGHVIDLSEKRRLLLTCVGLYALAAAIFFFLFTHYTAQHLSNHRIATCIYGVIFCTGIVRSFGGPTFTVLVATIVRRELLQNATTWNQGAYMSASVMGHAIGGFLIAGYGITGTLAVIFFVLIVSILFLFRLHKKPPLNESSEKRTWESVRE